MSNVPHLAELVAGVNEDIKPHIGPGRATDYIPAMARVGPRKFGLAIATCKGEPASVGDCSVPSCMQSVSKVFTLTLALGRLVDTLWQRAGRLSRCGHLASIQPATRSWER